MFGSFTHLFPPSSSLVRFIADTCPLSILLYVVLEVHLGDEESLSGADSLAAVSQLQQQVIIMFGLSNMRVAWFCDAKYL